MYRTTRARLDVILSYLSEMADDKREPPRERRVALVVAKALCEVLISEIEKKSAEGNLELRIPTGVTNEGE